MWNVFEQPWTLLVIAGIALLVVMTFRAICPDRQRPWQWAIPILLVVMAFALDLAVATDREKIHTLMRDTLKAGQRQDIPALEALLAEDYQDSFHRDKRRLVEHARTGLQKSPMASIKQISFDLEQLEPPHASVALFVVTTFDPNSLVAQTYRPVLFVGLRFVLTKQPDRRWLIKAIELGEVDKQPLTWSQINSNI
jgi:hypothetical protein